MRAAVHLQPSRQRVQSSIMSNSYHKTVMCNVCGKVMRDDHVKRHMSVKHRTKTLVQQRGEDCQLQQRQATFASDVSKVSAEDVQQDRSFEKMSTEASNQEIEASAEMDSYDEELLEVSKANCTHVKANLKFELMRNNETYKKNIAIGEQISDVLRDGEIVEKSLTKQHKFCLDLFRAWQPTVDVANAELRLWQEQLLDIINEDEMNDRKIIWVKGEKVTKESLGFNPTCKACTERTALLVSISPTRRRIFYTS